MRSSWQPGEPDVAPLVKDAATDELGDRLVALVVRVDLEDRLRLRSALYKVSPQAMSIRLGNLAARARSFASRRWRLKRLEEPQAHERKGPPERAPRHTARPLRAW